MGVVIKKKKKKINVVRDGCTAFQINEDFYKNILGPLSLILDLRVPIYFYRNPHLSEMEYIHPLQSLIFFFFFNF